MLLLDVIFDEVNSLDMFYFTDYMKPIQFTKF